MQLDFPSTIHIVPTTKSSSLWAAELQKRDPSAQAGAQVTRAQHSHGGRGPAGCTAGCLTPDSVAWVWRIWRDAHRPRVSLHLLFSTPNPCCPVFVQCPMALEDWAVMLISWKTAGRDHAKAMLGRDKHRTSAASCPSIFSLLFQLYLCPNSSHPFLYTLAQDCRWWGVLLYRYCYLPERISLSFAQG